MVKRSAENLWSQYGKVEVFSMGNGLFIFRFVDERTHDEVLEAKFWHIANKPLILRKWEPGMQLLKHSLSKIPIWIKLVHLPMEFWSSKSLGM